MTTIYRVKPECYEEFYVSVQNGIDYELIPDWRESGHFYTMDTDEEVIDIAQ